MAGQIEELTYDNGEGGIERDDYREFFALDAQGQLTKDAMTKREAVARYLKELAATGKTIVVLYPIPEAGWHVPGRMFKARMRGDQLGTVSTDFRRFERRNSFATSVLDSVSAPNLIRIKPADVLCNVDLPGRCLAQKDGVPLYFDEDHLSQAGAKIVVDEVFRRLQMN